MYPLKTKTTYNPWNLASTWNIYTTVYLWNYVTWDFWEWDWSHPWVDIVPQVKHDDIHACLDWVVHFAWTSDSNGNYVVLKHPNAPDPSDLSKTTTLYSCHLHLSSLWVSTWATVKEWDVIWKTGNTWNSTWEHLHFQIDTWNAPFHPYWPFTWKDTQAAWLWFFEAVNKWLGIENAKKYTINPLVYLDNVAANKWNKPIDATETKPIPAFATKSSFFNDVSDNIEEIDYLANQWIVKWYWDWSFRPESNVTRAELLAMVFNFAKVPLDANASCNFTDVQTSDWCCKYVATASTRWIIKWYSDNTFKPNNSITRAEAIAITLNTVIWKTNIADPVDSDYTDVKTTDWYCRYTNYVAQNWLLDSIGLFSQTIILKGKI